MVGLETKGAQVMRRHRLRSAWHGARGGAGVREVLRSIAQNVLQMNEQFEKETVRKAVEDKARSFGGKPVARGARRGMRWSDRWDIDERQLHLPGEPDAVRRRSAPILKEMWQEVENPDQETAGIVWSGMGKLNPVLVSLRFDPSPSGEGTRVTVRGVAAEGLIKQHAGSKAANLVSERLEQAL